MCITTSVKQVLLHPHFPDDRTEETAVCHCPESHTKETVETKFEPTFSGFSNQNQTIAQDSSGSGGCKERRMGSYLLVTLCQVLC